jgi:hypothetical protein
VRLAGSPAEIADEFGDSRLIGGPLIFASSTAGLFGAYEQTSGAAFIVSLPEFAWEGSLGIYLIAKGFSPSPTLS